MTRARGGSLVEGFERRGAIVEWIPLIEYAPPEDWGVVEAAARQVGSYDWVVFTSVSGVEWFVEALEGVGGGAGELGRLRIACTGPVTARAVEGLGLTPTVVPEEAIGESLLRAILEEAGSRGDSCTLEGQRFLLPLAAGARRVLERGLSDAGAIVERVETYHTIPASDGVRALYEALAARRLDLITFASPSAVEAFIGGGGGTEPVRLLDGVVVAVIGPITAAAAERAGIEVEITATKFTATGLIEGVVGYYSPDGTQATGEG